METIFNPISIAGFLVLIFSIVIHEVAHGSMAYSLGDDTAKRAGRLTLNPLSHIDWIGTIILPIFLMLLSSPVVIGWAKPVPVNYLNLTDRKWGPLKVSLAGPAANLLVALACGLLLRFLGGFFPEGLIIVLWLAVLYNILLALFNLIPVPPLDGSHILFSFLPKAYGFKQFMNQYGFFILIFIVFLTPFLNILFEAVLRLTLLLTGVSLL